MEKFRRLALMYPYSWDEIKPIMQRCLAIYDKPFFKTCDIIESAMQMNISLHDSFDLQYEIDFIVAFYKK